MRTFLKTHKIQLLLILGIVFYISYFSHFTVLRYKTLYASYFDLGIMHQTVYNTFQSIKNRDAGRFFELTNPMSPSQIKRSAIHNDLFLVLLAPFYFINAGPETLLVLQTFALGIAALFVYLIAVKVLKESPYSGVIGLSFAFAYLFYSPLEHANIFDFHAVTFAVPLLLGMFYFWISKRYRISFIFLVLAALTKEEVALTTGFFALFAFMNSKDAKNRRFCIAAFIFSVLWFFLSVSFIIPRFRGAMHFALPYYAEFGDSPSKIMLGLLKNPFNVLRYILRLDTLGYILLLTGPFAFLSLFAPQILLIALPEYAINLLSNDFSMRSTYFHYTSVIIPFVVISAVYGTKKLTGIFTRQRKPKRILVVTCIMVLATIGFAFVMGPLPFSLSPEVHPFRYPQAASRETAIWAGILKNDTLKLSTTGQIAPYFTGRRYFYFFSPFYTRADYVVIRPGEVYNYPEKNQLIPVYQKLKTDPLFERIYQSANLEVYRKKGLIPQL